jgi:predicted phage terminase large subunit-like protein
MKPSELQQRLFSDRKIRAEVTAQSHEWFFSTYFANYITHKTADLHRQLFAITEDEQLPLAVVIAFRGSAKSTIMTMSYPIWAIVGKQQKKFVLIASQTQYQARVHLMNIKRELESNELLANDLGPFVEQREEWGSTSLYIPKYNARITAISTEQSVRGIRHGAYRPDLIIADDVEDMASVKTREGRNKTFDWYTSEIIPAGDINTKRIAIGNLLHQDSLLMRLKELIDKDEIDGTYREFPIILKNKSLWPGKYVDKAALRQLQRNVANRIAWEREYMLRIIADEDQVIDNHWIKYHDGIPSLNFEHQDPQLRYRATYVGVDLAISQRHTADFTAMVAVRVFGAEENLRVYVYPLIINKRLSHLKTIDRIESFVNELGDKHSVRLVVEDVGYQASAIEQLQNKNYRVTGFKVGSADKRSRLMSVSHLFESGKVLFPQRGAKDLIAQLTGFGIEKHDDLMDALVMALAEVVKADKAFTAQTEVTLGKSIDEIYEESDWEDYGFRY